MVEERPEGNIVVCAATARELATCLGEVPQFPDVGGITVRGRCIFAVTGVGIPMSLLKLPSLLAKYQPKLVINIGIAGAYPGSRLSIGDIVVGESECFGDLGMETPDTGIFLPLAGQPWADEEYGQPFPLETRPFAALGDKPGREGAALGKGCTVNSCTGRKETGELRRELFGVDFESMEGAAIALAGKQAGLPVSEVRCISNLASDRDMRPANVAMALGNLGVYMRRWLGDFQ